MKAEQVPDTMIPFADEVVHLEEITADLTAALADADASIQQLDRDYADAKRYMVQHRGDIDPHEMFQSEQVLRQVDRSGAFAVGVRDRLAKLQESPYFARIDFRPGERDEASTYYIGRFAFTHDNALRIIDWRAPIAGVFYECELGPAGYDAPQGRIEGKLMRKRQFRIAHGVMEYALESADNVQDDVLQRELAHTSDERMKSIIGTIQKEQNVIIRNEGAETLIIQGVAGSGKTSIALHRVAYLLYRFKQQLSAQNVTILSPNRVFGDYISSVLPELGEEPIFEVSLQDIAGVQLEGILDFEPDRDPQEMGDAAWVGRVQHKSTLDFVRSMDAYIGGLVATAFEAREYRYESFVVSAGWILARLSAYAGHPLLRRLEMIADDIHDRFTTENIRGEELPRPRTILKGLKAMLTVKTTLALYKDFYRWLGRPDLLVMPGKKRLEWNDVFPFLYLHAAFVGLKASQVIRHLVIDEMQDYTPVQFAVLHRLFPCGKTILGDFGQAINPNHRHTREDLRALFPGAEYVELRKSYRSTCEIIDFARRIHPVANLEAIERHGPVPGVIACGSREAEIEQIRHLMGAFKASGQNTLGIILKTNDDAQALFDALSDEEIHLIAPGGRRFEAGISIVSVQMAKGLEFDEVIIPQADSKTYSSEHDRSLLYVSCTRAMHGLTLLHAGKPSPLLP